jgi:L-2,4-diaminobutyric acid acetyltransferase
MSVTMRIPSVHDGGQIWSIIRSTTNLDLNSPYCYFLLADHFADTCVLASTSSGPVGAVVGYRKPNDPQTLFVWQVAVAESRRGQGIGRAMLDHLVATVAPEHVEASVGPSNEASLRMFRSLARAWGGAFTSGPWLAADLFPRPGHEAEDLIRIGPLPPDRSARAQVTDSTHHARMANS